MSCEVCEKLHDKMSGYYFRIGRHNVLVVCCEEAAIEVQKMIRGR